MKIEIIPNDNDKEREDRSGRVRVSHRRTWILLVDDEFRSEHKTRREAIEAGKRTAVTDPITGRRPIPVCRMRPRPRKT
jgi:hypothetical protein